MESKQELTFIVWTKENKTKQPNKKMKGNERKINNITQNKTNKLLKTKQTKQTNKTNKHIKQDKIRKNAKIKH